MCTEYTRANAGGRYGRRSVEAKEQAGFAPASLVDRHYGTLWMARRCPECNCTSEEECLTLQDLGRYCETAEGAK